MAIICNSTTIKTVKVQNSNGISTEIFSVFGPNGKILYDKITVTLDISYVPPAQYQASYQTFKWQTAHKLTELKVQPYYTNEATGVTTNLAVATNANSGECTLQLPVNTNTYDATVYTYTVGVKILYSDNSYAGGARYTNVTRTSDLTGSVTIVI